MSLERACCCIGNAFSKSPLIASAGKPPGLVSGRSLQATATSCLLAERVGKRFVPLYVLANITGLCCGGLLTSVDLKKCCFANRIRDQQYLRSNPAWLLAGMGRRIVRG